MILLGAEAPTLEGAPAIAGQDTGVPEPTRDPLAACRKGATGGILLAGTKLSANVGPAPAFFCV